LPFLKIELLENFENFVANRVAGIEPAMNRYPLMENIGLVKVF